jgi:hypothetical protein
LSSQVLGRVTGIQRRRGITFAPQGKLNCVQKLLCFPIRRYDWFKGLLLRLHWLHMRLANSQPARKTARA